MESTELTDVDFSKTTDDIDDRMEARLLQFLYPLLSAVSKTRSLGHQSFLRFCVNLRERLVKVDQHSMTSLAHTMHH